MVSGTSHLTPGSAVRVPWGLEGDVAGTVVEVWGSPPAHIRVELHFADDSEPVTLLLSPDVVHPA